MENEKQVVELKIKSWKRKVKLAHTMLHKYESKLKRLEKKEQTARAALAKEIEDGCRVFKF